MNKNATKHSLMLQMSKSQAFEVSVSWCMGLVQWIMAFQLELFKINFWTTEFLSSASEVAWHSSLPVTLVGVVYSCKD